MIGKIFITSSGYDPERGRQVKDPYLGPNPSLGACRPDLRRRVVVGDWFFTISGKVPQIDQFLMGGFEVEAKVPATEAFRLFPEQRLRLEDGQIAGNIIVNGRGKQHKLDNHRNFNRRIENYVIGKNGIALATPQEIALGRAETLDALREILKKRGARPVDVVGRWGSHLREEQVLQLLDWLRSLKKKAA